jgi:hypothetical protein
LGDAELCGADEWYHRDSMAMADFKTVYAGVRPARVAVLVDTPDERWQETCRRILECFSATWGGPYNIIIPTDGRSIAHVFWQLLEALDPDYICRYDKTGLDWKLGAPELYEKVLQEHLRRIFGDGAYTQEQRDEIGRQIVTVPLQVPEIEPDLQRELKNRLAPLFFEDNVLNVASVSTRSTPGYPLTPLSTVLPNWERPNITPLSIDNT